MNIHLFTCKTISLYSSEGRHINTASQQRNKSPSQKQNPQTRISTDVHTNFCKSYFLSIAKIKFWNNSFKFFYKVLHIDLVNIFLKIFFLSFQFRILYWQKVDLDRIKTKLS